jgi:osmotically-inducible protein OsmY
MMPDDPDSSDDATVEWFDNGWIADRSADEWLAERAARALRTDPLIHGRRLEIIAQNGVIVLLGELATREAKEAARLRAWAVPGVLDVCNRLTVGD